MFCGIFLVRGVVFSLTLDTVTHISFQLVQEQLSVMVCVRTQATLCHFKFFSGWSMRLVYTEEKCLFFSSLNLPLVQRV